MSASRFASGAVRLRPHAAVLAAYAGAALLLTWPLVLHLGDAVVDGIDAWQSVWNMWAVAGRLAAGHSPFHTDLLYYPGGADLYLHTLFPAVSVPLAPLTGLAGPVVAYNVAQLLAFTLTGYTMYLLCRDLGASPAGAFLGGCGLDFCAWHLVRLNGHLNLASIYWMPLYLLFLFRLSRPRPGAGPVLAAGLCLALSALCDYQQAVYLALITGVWLLGRATDLTPRPPSLRGKGETDSMLGGRSGMRGRLELVARVGAVWALAGLLLAPVLVGLVRQQTSGGYVRPDLGQVVTFSADLLGYVVPYQYNTFVGPAVTPLVDTLWGKLDTERALYLTVTLLALGLWGLVHAWPRSRVWLAVFVVSVLLSLGPALHVGGQTSIPLPYLLLYLLPGADALRVPARFALPATLALAVLAAWGLTALEARVSARIAEPAARRRARALLAGLAGLALLVEELAVPHPLAAATVPDFYRELAARPAEGTALVEVPIRDEAVYEYYQTVHGRPLVGGYLSRDRIDPLIEGGPLLRDLKYLDTGDIVQQDIVVAGQALLARNHIGYIVVHTDPPMTRYLPWSPDQQAAARRLAAAAATPVYTDATLTAYALRPPPSDRPPTVALGAGWQPVTADPARGRGRWATTGAALLIDAARPATVMLSLSAVAYPAARNVRLLLGARELARWALPLGVPSALTSPPFALPAGVSSLTLASDTPPGLLPSAVPFDRNRVPAMLFATALRVSPVGR